MPEPFDVSIEDPDVTRARYAGEYDVLSTAFRREPTVALSHYTTADGLRGILSLREFWASDLRFLNDSAEVSTGLDLIRDGIQKRCKATREKEHPHAYFYDRISDGMFGFQRFPSICAISLSEEYDDLSQWRAYARAGGYSVTINPSALKSFVASNEGTLAKVEYKKTAHADIVKEFFAELDKRLESDKRIYFDTAEANFAANQFIRAALRVAALLKDESFKSEAEWRAIYIKPETDLDARVRRSLLVPFYKAKVPEDAIAGLEILVGPSPHQELARVGALKLYARYRGLPFEYMSPHVRNSPIPYRDW